MSLPQLRRRNRGRFVVTMQQALLEAAGDDMRDCLGVPFPRGRQFTDDGIFGEMTEQALRAFLEREKQSDTEFGVDGICGSQSWTALGVTQAARVQRAPARRTERARAPARTQGRQLGQINTSAIGFTAPPNGQDMPPWMTIAWQQESLNTRERPGPNRNNPHVLRYLSESHHLRNQLVTDDSRRSNSLLNRLRAQDVRQNNQNNEIERSYDGLHLAEVDETPWCGCFVQWCLSQVGIRRRPGFGGARSWRPTGPGDISLQRYGAVCAIQHSPNKFHVGFYLTEVAGGVKLLGGNQSSGGGGNGQVSARDFTGLITTDFLWPQLPDQ